MTESVVTLPHGSASEGGQRARVSARARGRTSVTKRDRIQAIRGSRVVVAARQIGRVAYLDAADSWIVRDSTPSIKQVWQADYSVTVPGGYAPFRYWCKTYRYPAVAAAAVFDSAKWMLIHPVRGPLFISTVGAGIAAAIY